MIVVDTSALMAMVQNEPDADRCAAMLEQTTKIAISAATFAEAVIVATLRKVGPEMQRLLEGLGLEIVPVTAGFSQRVADAYGRWGKGIHPARLNFGDCFAYALAEERGWPLLYVGQDFARTDVKSAL
jgi:ribonuclease VapC